jgi:hypothetical protein
LVHPCHKIFVKNKSKKSVFYRCVNEMKCITAKVHFIKCIRSKPTIDMGKIAIDSPVDQSESNVSTMR